VSRFGAAAEDERMSYLVLLMIQLHFL